MIIREYSVTAILRRAARFKLGHKRTVGWNYRIYNFRISAENGGQIIGYIYKVEPFEQIIPVPVFDAFVYRRGDYSAVGGAETGMTVYGSFARELPEVPPSR